MEEIKAMFDILIQKIDEQGNEIAGLKKITINLENGLTRKIESLFDGYKLTHEKQYELERRVEKLEQIIAELQSRIA